VRIHVAFSTTNGTRAILTAAAASDRVLLGSLLNLAAVSSAVRETGEDVVVLCVGFQQAFALDDAYCAGRIVELLDGDRTDAALAAQLVSRSFASPAEGLSSRGPARRRIGDAGRAAFATLVCDWPTQESRVARRKSGSGRYDRRRRPHRRRPLSLFLHSARAGFAGPGGAAYRL